QNDDPTTVNDRVTVGTIGAGSISPINTTTLWSQYFTGLGLDIPVPTEDQPLTIPAAFLLQNDLAGSGTALDENLFTNDNDGPLRIIDVSIDAGDATVELIEDGDGNVTGVLFTPPTNVYGDIVFTYVVEDRGVDEDKLGDRIVTPRTSTGT